MGEEHAIWLEHRDHSNVVAALYHLLGQTWPFIGCRRSLPKDVLQALPDATLPLHSFLIRLPIWALLVHRGNCWHCLKRDRKEKLRWCFFWQLNLGQVSLLIFFFTKLFLGPLNYSELLHAFLFFHFYLVLVILILISSSDSSSFIHLSTKSWIPTVFQGKMWVNRCSSCPCFTV